MRSGSGSAGFSGVAGRPGESCLAVVEYSVVGLSAAVEAVGSLCLLDFALTVLGAGGAGGLIGLGGKVVIESSSVWETDCLSKSGESGVVGSC